MLEIFKPGLETSIQDFPGRMGYWNQGFPPSGPMDNWSFRLANILVGNDAGAPGLEAQFMGPTLKFQKDGVIAVTGADMAPTVDGAKIPMWQSVAVKAGQSLVMGPALSGGDVARRCCVQGPPATPGGASHIRASPEAGPPADHQLAAPTGVSVAGLCRAGYV